MTKPKIRCAIYTRKSSDEGLDQDFNSLDAQYEAAKAFIASQRHEGWILDKTRYDDGGISGATLKRPGLQRLLDNIDAGRIQMVVVYKIDRLTRALTDFARLVERLDAASCSFVSVTQAFNTANSMGRLTLNVLLSFAQFEREVTAERIRDKIAASKKKGLWMGGLPPLGYDPHPDPKVRSLVVNPEEADRVRAIYQLYDTHQCLSAVAREAAHLGLRSKHHIFASGRTQGGNTLSRGQIYALLRNPIYLGKIRHKDQVWDGQHDAILDQDLWNRIQAKLQAANARPRRARGSPEANRTAKSAPLTGKLRDETGDRLTPTHTKRHGRQFRYYVSHRLITKGPDPAAWRLPALDLERCVGRIIAEQLEKHASTQRLLRNPDASGGTSQPTPDHTILLALRQGAADPLKDLILEGIVARGSLNLTLCTDAVASLCNVPPGTLSQEATSITTPFDLRRRGVEAKIIAGQARPMPDQTLITALAKAHKWAEALRNGEPLCDIARKAGHSDSYIRTRTPLAFLAPSIQKAIIEGRQPPDLTLERLVRVPIPMDWQKQRQIYAIA